MGLFNSDNTNIRHFTPVGNGLQDQVVHQVLVSILIQMVTLILKTNN